MMVMGFSVEAPGTLGFDNIEAHTKSYLALILCYVQEAARPQPHCASATSAVVATVLVVSRLLYRRTELFFEEPTH